MLEIITVTLIKTEVSKIETEMATEKKQNHYLNGNNFFFHVNYKTTKKY